MKKLLTLTLFMVSTQAQNFSVIPASASGGSVVNQVGNANSPAGCAEGSDLSKLNITISPSCYGANLRKSYATVDPSGNPIEMVLKLTNGTSVFKTSVSFPARTMWPTYYGHSCTPSGTSVTCTVGTTNVSYTGCTYSVGAAERLPLARLNNCKRSGDPLSQGDLNKVVDCSYQYIAKDAAGRDITYRYTKTGKVSCGLVLGADKFTPASIVVNAKSPATGIVSSKFSSVNGKRGEKGFAEIPFNGITFPRKKRVYNMATGKFNVTGKSTSVSAAFYQKQGTAYKKLSGTHDKFAFSNDAEQCLTLSPTFVGNNTFCGSFYSPLMLFFGKDRPKFNAVSSFPLYMDSNPLVYWVEEGAPGYFLIHDKNGNGEVDNGLELFGDNLGSPNGFESLRPFDSNQDDVVDAKDKEFAKLQLWKDKNGNGITDKGEIISLKSMGVESISLKYRKDDKSFGNRAESREKSQFTYKKGGKAVKSMILDIYFAQFRKR